MESRFFGSPFRSLDTVLTKLTYTEYWSHECSCVSFNGCQITRILVFVHLTILLRLWCFFACDTQLPLEKHL
jgi:hypothetical protein